VGVYKNERQLVSKWIRPRLKGRDYFARTGVKILPKVQKLITEDVLTPSEARIEHTGSPDIDVVFWKTPPVSGSDPVFYGAEVKYFRLIGKQIYPQPFYVGIDEAFALLTFGFNYVFLWHFFDSEIEEAERRLYTGLTTTITSSTGSQPINYNHFTVEPETTSSGPVSRALDNLFFPLPLPQVLQQNPLLKLPEVQRRRLILRRALRIV